MNHNGQSHVTSVFFFNMLGWPANDANCPLLFNFCSGFIAGNGDRRSFIIQEVQYGLLLFTVCIYIYKYCAW
jgi:hypothetical protein